MITLITGFPGSGKTYYSINKIFDIMNDNHPLAKSIDTIFTNINGLKYNSFPDKSIKLKKLNIEEFYTYLQDSFLLYEENKNDDNLDDFLIKHSKECGFFNSLIIFDECHDFLSQQDRVKIYWLTYHRHLHLEIDLLTQNKSLINVKYRAIPELFIEAQPRSKKLFSNTLSYKHFAAFAMRKADLFSRSSIKTKQEVFSLYKSGNTSKQKSILSKFILIASIGLFFTIVLFYYIFDSLTIKEEEVITPDSTRPRNINQQVNNTNRKPLNTYEDEDNNIVIKIIFDSREGYYIYNEYYSIIHFKKFIRKTNSKLISKYILISNKNYKLSNLYIRTNKEALERFFIMPKQNRKESSIDDIKINF